MHKQILIIMNFLQGYMMRSRDENTSIFDFEDSAIYRTQKRELCALGVVTSSHFLNYQVFFVERVSRASMFALRTPLTAKALTRSFNSTSSKQSKVLCALYEGGVAGKQNKHILGCVENELGLREFLDSRGHELVVTSDKDGKGSTFEKHLPDADVVSSQPFWPAYLTKERIDMAHKLKLAITAGVGSDHVDLQAACDRNITVDCS